MKGSRRPKFQRKKPNQESREARDEIPSKLPQVVDQLSMTFVYRFVTQNLLFTGAFAVTPGMLLDAWFIAGTATNSYQLFDFVKVRKVVIRSMGYPKAFLAGTNNGNPPCATVGVEFMGLSTGSVAGGRQKSDTSLGFDQPAMVSLKPDPMSQAAQYQQNTGSTIFTVRAVDQDANALAGTIIDVHVSLRNSGDVNPAAVANARAGLTPGNLYFGGLDGNPLATTAARSVFIPRA